MDFKKSMDLIDKYSICPSCGNDKLGNGEGGIVLESYYLKRFCNCGFSIIVNEDDKKLDSGVCSVCKTETPKELLTECEVCKEEFCNFCANIDYSNNDVCCNCYIDSY